MAKKSVIAKNVKKQKLVEKGKLNGKRAALKKVYADPSSTPEDIMRASIKLQKLPVNESPSRLTAICKNCGRNHAVYNRFGLCRLCVRSFFVKGFLPGVVKSSW